jgi:hypothetical protein
VSSDENAFTEIVSSDEYAFAGTLADLVVIGALAITGFFCNEKFKNI